jgi:thiol-disulfide isomerase/thioredoxin
MIKKITSALAFVLITMNSFGQTIVTTSPENKKVVLEEFTGIKCVFCPEGHAIAQAIQDNNPENVFLINIHSGGFAVPNSGEPDFRVPDGNTIRSFFGVTGYPSGMVNRHIFSGGNPVMGRGQWTSSANSTLSESSYVNVGVEAEIDLQTRELTVHVEAYYTGNSPESTNKLSIALLQNNTLGPQTGGDVGDQYVHMHRLVDLITPPWGVVISPTTTGTFIDETFTYSIPENYNNVPAELGDMEVVALLAETNAEIPSGAGAKPVYTSVNANDANVRYIEDINDQCGFDLSPSINVQNLGSNPITSLSIEYSVNSGTVETYNWTGLINPAQNESIELPGISYTIDPAGNTVDVDLGSDDDNSNNQVSATFENAITSTESATLILNTGTNGSQISWDITTLGGSVVANGGPYSNNQSLNVPITLNTECHRFEIRSTNGNGASSVVLFDSNSEILYSSNGDFGFAESSNFNSQGVLGSQDEVFERLSIYPNPVDNVLNIMNAENAAIEIYNILGQLLYTKNDISIYEQIEVSQFISGTYLIKVKNGNAVKTSKFVKK